MRRWAVIVIAVGVAGSGCKNLNRDSSDRQPPPPRGTAGNAAPRGNTTTLPTSSVPNPHWLDNPPNNDLPPNPSARAASTGNDLRGPSISGQTEVKGTLAGFVDGSDGRKLRGVFIEVEPVGGVVSAGKPIGVQTDDQGYFLIKGLKPEQTYILTAHATRDGQAMGGQVYAKTPNVHVRLPLIDGLALGSGRSPSGSPNPFDTPSPSPASTVTPPPPLPSPQPRTDNPNPTLSPPATSSPDGSWSPTGPSPIAPIPPVSRPDLMTDGPQPGIRPPATNIPPPASNIPPPGLPTELPPPLSSTGKPNTTLSRSVRPKTEFVLLDTLGRPREFPSGRPEELILLDFMTTTCGPCKKAVPVLKDLQSRYGSRGLDVIGVTCDIIDTPQRRAVASAYQRDHGLNYLLYVEPGSKPGAVMDRYGVKFFPTLVLITGTGEVLWKGDARDRKTLEAVITERLGQ